MARIQPWDLWCAQRRMAPQPRARLPCSCRLRPELCRRHPKGLMGQSHPPLSRLKHESLYSFKCGCVGWVLVAALKSLSLQPAGFSLVVARGLQLPCGMWDLSYLRGDQTCGPALKGRFLTTETTREVPPLILRLRLPGFPTGRSCALSMEPLINSFSTEEPD